MKIFIPIKQVSQRVPRKNFRLFRGEPLYKHTLLKFTNHDIFVDTDSQEVIQQIKSDPRLLNVSAYKREESLCGHKVSVCDLIENFINKFSVKEPIVQIHVTSPFLTEELIEDAYSYVGTHDSVISCNLHNSRFWRREQYGFCPVNHNPVKMEQTQDLPTLYEENSAFYIFTPEVLCRTGSRVGKNPYFYPISAPYNMDIDTEEDWKKVLDVM